jgi:hypothetical protein
MLFQSLRAQFPFPAWAARGSEDRGLKTEDSEVTGRYAPAKFSVFFLRPIPPTTACRPLPRHAATRFFFPTTPSSSILIKFILAHLFAQVNLQPDTFTIANADLDSNEETAAAQRFSKDQAAIDEARSLRLQSRSFSCRAKVYRGSTS